MEVSNSITSIDSECSAPIRWKAQINGPKELFLYPSLQKGAEECIQSRSKLTWTYDSSYDGDLNAIQNQTKDIEFQAALNKGERYLQERLLSSYHAVSL